MIAKLIVEGKEFPIEIQDPELQKLLAPQKKTGYERVERKDAYYYVNVEGDILPSTEYGICFDNHYDEKRYDAANYYSDQIVAQNNARADKLMRQLRRFAVEHRNGGLDYDCGVYTIHWDVKLITTIRQYSKDFGNILFDSCNTCNLAIQTFHDELIWYFTEYKDSL